MTNKKRIAVLQLSQEALQNFQKLLLYIHKLPNNQEQPTSQTDQTNLEQMAYQVQVLQQHLQQVQEDLKPSKTVKRHVKGMAKAMRYYNPPHMRNVS